jgi:hypothetical protein
VGAFCLVVLTVQAVDHVELLTNQRTVFSRQQAAAAAGNGGEEGTWREELVNP